MSVSIDNERIRDSNIVYQNINNTLGRHPGRTKTNHKHSDFMITNFPIGKETCAY